MPFDINDTHTFDDNLAAFVKSLESSDPELATVLAQKLPELIRGDIQLSDVWDSLETAVKERSR